jgi:multicomponent Na+:H+ antiporter subunit D
MSELLILPVVIPLFAGALNALIGKFSDRLRYGISIASLLLLIGIALVILRAVGGGEVLTYKLGGWPPPTGICLAVDTLSALMLLAISFVSLLCAIYSIPYLKGDTGVHLYDSLFMFLLAGMNGVVVTGDVFNMYVFLEITSICTYSLVAFRCGSRELRAGLKYAIISMVGMSFFLLGVGFLYNAAGTLNMADAGRIIQAGTVNPTLLSYALICILIGLWVNSAVAPMHTWLPDAHPAAPSPMSAVLSGLVVKVSIYSTLRIICTVYGLTFSEVLGPLLVSLGLLTMLTGAFLALVQTDIKRLLAYSTVGSMGFILAGIGAGNIAGIQGSTFHVINHALAKAMLFLVAGCLIYRLGTRDMRKIGGLIKVAPVEATAFLLGGLAVAGVPPLNGFWSKLLIYIGLYESKMYVPLAIATGASLLFLAVYLRAFKLIFLGQGGPHTAGTPKLMLGPVIALCAVTVLIGVLPNLPLNFTQRAAEQVLNRVSYIQTVLGTGP